MGFFKTMYSYTLTCGLTLLKDSRWASTHSWKQVRHSSRVEKKAENLSLSAYNKIFAYCSICLVMKEHSGRKEAQYGDVHKILFTKVVSDRGGLYITINLFENAMRAPLSAQYL